MDNKFITTIDGADFFSKQNKIYYTLNKKTDFFSDFLLYYTTENKFITSNDVYLRVYDRLTKTSRKITIKEKHKYVVNYCEDYYSFIYKNKLLTVKIKENEVKKITVILMIDFTIHCVYINETNLISLVEKDNNFVILEKTGDKSVNRTFITNKQSGLLGSKIINCVLFLFFVDEIFYYNFSNNQLLNLKFDSVKYGIITDVKFKEDIFKLITQNFYVFNLDVFKNENYLQETDFSF